MVSEPRARTILGVMTWIKYTAIMVVKAMGEVLGQAMLFIVGGATLCGAGALSYLSIKYPKEFEALTAVNNKTFGNPEQQDAYRSTAKGTSFKSWELDGQGIFDSIPDSIKNLIVPSDAEKKLQESRGTRETRVQDYVEHVKKGL